MGPRTMSSRRKKKLKSGLKLGWGLRPSSREPISMPAHKKDGSGRNSNPKCHPVKADRGHPAVLQGRSSVAL